MPIPLKLQVFEGPMDLLMHLIEKNRIDIYDIPIVTITDQYLEYVRQMEHSDMNVTSEFLVMAATLLDIKSRMLLPREENDDWLYLVPNCAEPPIDSITARVKYRDPHNLKRAYIASHAVVKKIVRDYYIYRKNPCIYAPFYILREDTYNGKRCVRICMDNFEQHKDE
jgi:hypothetical protein